MTSFTDDVVGDPVASGASPNNWYGIYFLAGANGGSISSLQTLYGYYGIYHENLAQDLSVQDLTVNYEGSGSLSGTLVVRITTVVPAPDGSTTSASSPSGPSRRSRTTSLDSPPRSSPIPSEGTRADTGRSTSWEPDCSDSYRSRR